MDNKMDTRKVIVLVEDDEFIRNTIAFALRKNGFVVHTAVDGHEGLETIRRMVSGGEPVHLVLTDLQMPHLSGLEMIRAMRGEEIHLPVFVISGYGSKETVTELLRLGCVDYLDKPFTPTILLECLRAAFDRIESGRPAAANELPGLRRRSADLAQQQELFRDHLELLREHFQGDEVTPPSTPGNVTSIFYRPCHPKTR